MRQQPRHPSQRSQTRFPAIFRTGSHHHCSDYHRWYGCLQESRSDLHLQEAFLFWSSAVRVRLGLATPVAIMVGNGMGAKNGIMFKTAVSLEETGKMQIVALDKTGTITKRRAEGNRYTYRQKDITEEELLTDRHMHWKRKVSIRWQKRS